MPQATHSPPSARPMVANAGNTSPTQGSPKRRAQFVFRVRRPIVGTCIAGNRVRRTSATLGAALGLSVWSYGAAPVPCCKSHISLEQDAAMFLALHRALQMLMKSAESAMVCCDCTAPTGALLYVTHQPGLEQDAAIFLVLHRALQMLMKSVEPAMVCCDCTAPTGALLHATHQP